MGRNLTFSIGEYYHLYHRGVEKRKIFLDKNDRARFLWLLYVCNSNRPVVFKNIQGLSLDEIDVGDRLVAIGAYCLMPNHVHILVKEISENGISYFAKKLFTAYAMYFNTKNARKGRLFESVFQSRHASNDRYLRYLYAYIHLNPVKIIDPKWKAGGIKEPSKALQFLDKYIASSYQDYIGQNRPEHIILNREEFPDYFNKKHDFREEISDWIHYKDFVNQG